MAQDSSNQFSNQKIVTVELREEMRKSFIDYAMSVIISRAIPDVRDGLKPVHRRIIYGMYELGLNPNERYRKSAKTVGDVMANFHPHGDSAIYESLVRLAQPSASRYPLIDGHGNFGDLDNPPAAMRYTEAKLAKISLELLQDIEAETVDMRSNFDDTKKEPVVLPSRVPTLLLNGSTGIAVGMATNIPPHNLTEVMNGIIAKIDSPDLTSKELMQYIKGPDFPSGGIIMGTDGIVEAYETGRGSVPMRGEATIEQLQGSGSRQSRMAIIVTSLPYMIGPEAFAKKVADLVKDEKLTGISDINDETNRHGIRIVIELKRDAHPDVILNNLYKYTQLQQSFSINTLALVNNRPMTLKLSDLLSEFIDHRIEVVTRRTKYYLRKAKERSHILTGYLKALKNLDAVIKLIRASSSTEDARTGLMKDFDLDEIQANAILEMQLRRLTSLEQNKIETEHSELQVKIADFESILQDRQRVLDIIKKECIEIRDKYGDERKTIIESKGSKLDLSVKDLTPNEPMVVFITKQDYAKRLPLDTFKRQRRNTRGASGLKTRDEDDLQHLFFANSHDKLLVFTSKGLVYPLEVLDIPEASKSAKGLALINLISIDQDETVTAVIPVNDKKDDSFLIMLTQLGFIKKVKLSEYFSIRKTGITAVNLVENDKLCWVRQSDGLSDIIIATSDGMTIRFSEQDLRTLSRVARGVKSITLRQGDSIVGFDVIKADDQGYALVITNDGFGKRVKLEEFRQQSRAGVGLIGIKFKNSKSRLAILKAVDENDEVIIASANGIIVRQKTADISSQGRMATGVRIQQLDENDEVVNVTIVVDAKEELEE